MPPGGWFEEWYQLSQRNCLTLANNREIQGLASVANIVCPWSEPASASKRDTEL
jgi:hypothetical protein